MKAGGAWGILLESARRQRRALLVVVFFALASTGASLVQPLIYGAVVNDLTGLYVYKTRTVDQGEAAGAVDTSRPHRRGHVEPRTEAQAARTLIIAIIVLFAVNLLSRIFAQQAENRSARAAASMERGLMSRALGHVLRLPLSFFVRRSTGGIAKQIDLTDQVSPIVGSLAKDVLPEALCIIGALVIMFTQHVTMTLVALITLPAYLLISRALALRLQNGLDGYYERWEQLSGAIQEPLGAIKTVKLAGAERLHTARFDAVASAAYDDHLARTRIQNRYLLWQVACVHLGQALVLAYGGWRVIEHNLTPGDVVMFVAYLDLIYAPIDRLTSALTELQDHFAKVGRTARLMAAAEEGADGVALPAGNATIEFRDVHFGYVPEQPILKGLSFTAEGGATTALVGPSGAGKTTAADLLMRLFEPQSGAILFDGVPIAEIAPASLRRDIAVVATDGALFSGSMADNIRYYRADATDAEIREAAAAAGLGATLARLPEGLATLVGERGGGLSVGERQRLQIARVLASRARILVMDEATANLDYATELDVKAAIAGLRQGRTTIVIAHRHAMVEDADRVVVIESGQASEIGAPGDLARGEGWFARFARSAHASPPKD